MRRLILLCLAAALLGCMRSPIEENRICGPCAAPGTVPPSESAVQDALLAARGDAALTCKGVTSAIPVPAVAWWQCRTSTWGHDTPGGRDREICAAGTTSPDGKTIFVSLDNPSNTLRLVWGEGRNSFWMRGGCAGQAY